MDLSIKWNKNHYQDFLNYLKDNADTKYKAFQQKLLKDKHIKVIGIRVPTLRKIAQKIQDLPGFLNCNTHTYYEEDMLAALVIAKIEDNQKYIDEFILYINNWAVNDIFAGSLKCFKDKDISATKPYLNSDNPWSVRFGLTLLLNYYVTSEYLKEIFIISEKITVDHYYVKMANAWLLSICYIKFPKETEKFLQNTTLDNFTYNKTISKICDSYRVSKNDKIKLKEMKKRRNL